MFNLNRKNGSVESPLLAVIGDAARLEGKFTIDDSIQIECEIAGEINVEGKLVIGEKGVVRAAVNTVDAIIKGQYQGDMVVTGDVVITSTGRVSGSIVTDSLVIAKGGFFNGTVAKMEESAGMADKHHSGPALVEAAAMDTSRNMLPEDRQSIEV